MECEEEQTAFEIAVVVSKEMDRRSCECVEVLVDEFKRAGLMVDTLHGVSDEFIQLAAPLEIIGRAATKLYMKKPTHIGMDLQFKWEEVDAFARQPDGSLFSWCERYRCYRHLIYSIVNQSKSDVSLKYGDIEVCWKVGESLLHRLESENIVKQVFPLHVETKRKKLLNNWALNLWDFTRQPIDDIHSYFGMKIATYFTFLGMYTRWLFFPAVLGLLLQFVDFGPFQVLVVPAYFASIILWAVSFFQFWKRKNCALLARWQINSTIGTDDGSEFLNMDWSSQQSPTEIMKKLGADKTEAKKVFRKYEWFGHLLRFRNDALVVSSIICLQLPFELTYAHLYEVIGSNILKFALTAVYLFAIQYFTKLGATISVWLIKHENNKSTEYRADSLVYKVFGLYFLQTYIGIFYHVLLHRNFSTLRQVLVQRLIISEVFGNLGENFLPYIKYRYKKCKANRNKKKREGGSYAGKITSRVEKEYLKPVYSASIGYDLEDGLFDDFLELALQFGMIVMFACAYPLAFAFAALNNVVEIRADALKLLTILRRPVPRAAATIGAWLNIFQFLIVMSICTNSALLVWMYDHEGKWKIEPGLAAILVLEHILLLIKFGISHFVPEEPAWVKASRVKNETQVQDVCSKQLLRSVSGGVKSSNSLKGD